MVTKSAIVVHPDFDHVWPWAADHFHAIWQSEGPVDFVRVPYGERRAAHTVIKRPDCGSRLACFGLPFDESSLAAMPALKEMAAPLRKGTSCCPPAEDSPLLPRLADAGIKVIWHRTEEFWGQSVSEFALALTLCGLRRIPQTHHRILSSLDDWDYSQPDGIGKPMQRGQQYGDDSSFTNGTLESKRVRVVGAGNIGSRYASFCDFLGADVSIWDPFAAEPCFHRAGARHEYHLDRLMHDAEIFAPMLPLTGQTEGLIAKGHIEMLPKGCLVVIVTRARICDCEALYQRVLNGELALAADVFDHEPLGIGDSLLGRKNVIHTPHNAGRTKEANQRFAEILANQFSPLV